ncbi:MAG: ABC transporter permease [Bdellovibrionales bacterium RBG_16_40_8]|nr:MAG: ABC transporter permease [Bdellovibrionales bacterium RBG_16_40_8]
MKRKIINFLNFVGGIYTFSKQCLQEFAEHSVSRQLLIAQLQNVGVKSIPIVLIVSSSVGMVMALQFGIGLEKFSGKLYIPKVVTVSILRELGPIFAGLMFAARVGSGITSEVASMVVTQQIDAIRALGTSPIQKIVLPRILACLISLPILTVFANIIGIMSGLFVGSLDLGLPTSYYMQKIRTSIILADYLSGFGKTFFFALFVSIPACYLGLHTKRGTRGVGSATTTAVVAACTLILIGDYFLTKFFWIIESWK